MCGFGLVSGLRSSEMAIGRFVSVLRFHNLKVLADLVVFAECVIV